MNLDEGGEGAPLSGLVRLMQGLPPLPRRRGLFGSEYERFMGARRPSAAQLFALADHVRGGGAASVRPANATGGVLAAGAGGERSSEALQPVDVLTSQGPVQRGPLTAIPNRLTRMANGTFDDASIYFLPIRARPTELSTAVPKAERSVDYLAASPVARDAIASMTANRVPTEIIQVGPKQEDRTIGRGNAATAYWDPDSGLETINVDGLGAPLGPQNKFSSNGKLMSPALLWFHEMDHAVNYLSDPTAFKARVGATLRNGYDNQEERRVIDGPERTVALQLGEPTRTNHTGDYRKVKIDPTYPRSRPR